MTVPDVTLSPRLVAGGIVTLLVDRNKGDTAESADALDRSDGHDEPGPMNGNDFIAAVLRAEGVEWLACFPNNPLIEAAAKVGIRPIAFRHERGAVMAADGFSRLSDRQRFGVVAVQSQAGAENALGGIAQAFADNVPILVLPGGVNTWETDVKPNFSSVQNFAGVTKRAESLRRVQDIGPALRRAYAALRNGPAGPVILELTADVCGQPVEGDPLSAWSSPPRARQSPEPAAIEAAVAQLAEAKRPMIWAGGGVLSAGATDALRQLAEASGLPVFTTMAGKSAIDERHPLALGAGGMTTTGPAREWLDGSDCILALGTSLTRTPYGQRIPGATPLIHNSDNPDEIGKDENVAVALPGDVGLTMEALTEAATASSFGLDADDTAEQVSGAHARWREQWQTALEEETDPLSYYRIISVLNETLDLEQSVVTHDAGAPRDCLVPFFCATTPHSYVGWGKTTHLGFGLPLAIGAKLAMPDRFCLNVMGDGAFGMSGLDLETAVRAGVPITTLLLNNGAMATYPEGTPLDPVTARTQYGVTHMGGDYAAIAEGMGAIGRRVRTSGELAEFLVEASELNAEGATVLLDVTANVEARRSPQRPTV